MTWNHVSSPIQSAASHGFYRQPNGWITVSPAADFDQLHYINRGWTFLRDYGRCEIRDEYTADHPFENMFFHGGAKEFNRTQIIESGWNLNPPLIPGCRTALSQNHPRHNRRCMDGAVPVVWPQLNDGDYEEFPCRFCERDPFALAKAREQHETTMHKEEKSDIRQGQTTADALIAGLSPLLSAMGGQPRQTADVLSGLR